jgi:hypothetical protein
MGNVNRKLGVNAAIILKFGDQNQATVKGINQLTLPALTRSKIKTEEFGVDFAVNDAGGGEHGDIAYSGNMVFGDTKGQDQLRTYLKNNTKFTDARVYIDTVTGDFLAADTVNDPEAGFQVLSHTPGGVNKNGTYSFSGSWCVNGLYVIAGIHKTDVATPTMAFVAAGGGNATITDSASGFVTAGFVAGQTLFVDGSTSNDGIYTIKTVAAGTLTLDDGQSLSSEAALATTSLHAGTL